MIYKTKNNYIMKKAIIFSAIICIGLSFISCSSTSPKSAKGNTSCGAYGNP